MKFFNLLGKELQELINKQMIISLIVMFVMLNMMSGFMGSTMEQLNESEQAIVVCDEDNTDFTAEILAAIESMGVTVSRIDGIYEDRAVMAEKSGKSSFVIIPEGFTDDIFVNSRMGEIEVITTVKSTSVMSQMDTAVNESAITLITSTVQNLLLSEKYDVDVENIQFFNAPISTKQISIVGEKSAEVSSSVLINFISTQSMIVPLVIFILVIFSSQTIVTAISTEKIDKTLETLLSAPVSRISVLGSKMLAAAIVSLINAVVYMIGFNGYISSMMVDTSDVVSMASDALSVSAVMSELGIKMSALGYFLLGLQMFLTILISLSISLILGALVENAKSAQTIIMPITFCAMIPYLVSMFSDIDSLSMPVRMLLYAIPFTHTFNAANNIIFGNMTAFWGGLAYQCVILVICMTAALKIFTSDKIFTVSLNFGQKRKLSKSK